MQCFPGDGGLLLSILADLRPQAFTQRVCVCVCVLLPISYQVLTWAWELLCLKRQVPALPVCRGDQPQKEAH